MKNKWELKIHSHQIADTGDYDGHHELTNGKLSIITRDDPDEESVLQSIVDAFNNSECEFTHPDCHGIDLYIAEHRIKELTAELNYFKALAEAADKLIPMPRLWQSDGHRKIYKEYQQLKANKP